MNNLQYSFLGRKLFFVLFFPIALLTFYPLQAQSSFSESSSSSDSLIVLPRRPWVAAGQVVLQNGLLGAFNRYVTKTEFSKISLNTIKDNFRRGFVWDNDSFEVNMIGHPYQGSVYFNAARSNGLNFWQSVPYVVGGSLMWEFVMENEPPALNDLFSTSLGGMALGEICFRLSDLVLDQGTSGVERVFREIGGGLLSPGRALNRLLTGEAWRITPSTRRVLERHPTELTISVGPRYFSATRRGRRSAGMLGVELSYSYGSSSQIQKSAPFDWFYFRAGLSLNSKQPDLYRINALGSLYRRPIMEKGRHTLQLGAFQHFDYYDSADVLSEMPYDPQRARKNAPYRIGAPAVVGPGLLYHMADSEKSKWSVYLSLYANALLMGSSLSDYYSVEKRNYNLGSGYSGKLYSNISYGRRWSLISTLESYNMYTWEGVVKMFNKLGRGLSAFDVQGDESHTHLHLGESVLMYSPGRWRFKWANAYVIRHTNYRYRENRRSENYTTSLTVGYTL